MFGRRKREQAAEAAREAERHALFEKLAQRPENICPFLGLAAERTGYVDGVSDEHRCYAFGDPAPLSAEQQTRVCQERGYGNCPRYLRGVLVIPTEELEALRRPRAPLPPPPPRPAVEERRRRGVPLAIIFVLLLAVAAGGGVAYLLLGDRLIGLPNDTPTPSALVATPSPSPSPSLAASVAPTDVATPEPVETPRPTPQPGDVFLYFEVDVEPGDYRLFQVDEDGDTTDSQVHTFSRDSNAPVGRFDAPNGLRHWRTIQGALSGWSYIHGESGPFQIYSVFSSVEGGEPESWERVPEDEL